MNLKTALFISSLAVLLSFSIQSCQMESQEAGYYTLDGNIGDVYGGAPEHPFVEVLKEPTSTFSIDVDHASYTNIRRFITESQKPPVDAVRIEEFINYFTYGYEEPSGNGLITVRTDLASCPWNSEHYLIRVGLKGKKIEQQQSPASNLVFLIDCSGSMSGSDRLDLIKQSFTILADQLRPQDRVAIVTYSQTIEVPLSSTSGSEKAKIKGAIDGLTAAGGTNGGAGIQKAYEIALANKIEGGVNRVILATDGDFNIGITSTGELLSYVEEQRNKGISITCLGVGRGNLHDGRMETLADNGDGNYYYLDGLAEANQVLASELAGTIVTIARDVKVQATFDATVVKSYRLIGYDNRRLNNDQFSNDSVDAGDLGTGEEVTALYEIIPQAGLQPLSQPVLTFDVRFKRGGTSTSELVSNTLYYQIPHGNPSIDITFAAAVAEFGLILRDSKFKANASLDNVLTSATSAKGTDNNGERQEFIDLVQKYRQLK